MVEVVNEIPELKRLQTNTKVDEKFFQDYIQTFKKRIWIGNNPSKLSVDFPNYTYDIPNFYEFKHNLPISSHRKNGKVGFFKNRIKKMCSLDERSRRISFNISNGFTKLKRYNYIYIT